MRWTRATYSLGSDRTPQTMKQPVRGSFLSFSVTPVFA